MPSPEHGPFDPRSRPESPAPLALPEALAEFLRSQEYAAILQATDQGSIYVCKAPRRDIDSLHGPIPIGLVHSLYEHPSAPVIRSVLALYDRPDQPLTFESFVNVGDPDQRDDFASLAQQRSIALAFYNESLENQLNKRIANRRPTEIATILSHAERLRDRIPHDFYDFDHAKAAVTAATNL